ncbi:lysine--tRNA ligase [Halopelagius longus]|uniref:Lysine--tRNA ligase n=1 Tax=Halopelagius longus TaxID=1236180 RepID=A0A1H0XT09_9EURY|nr:lysine--tRNA ligase [Halopelagius longus]RDI72067.1 lysine--tRNA ligase [Halopelagius longus]SDQ05941.1 lysyl-tRNA synthetase, class I [Halopelagius longus]
MTDDTPESEELPSVDAESEATTHRAFWADEIADQIAARDPEDPIVIKGGVSPSGVPHLGHFNEIMRGYFVAEALRERGHEVRQVFTSDDKDALRKLPRKLADDEWNVVGLGDVNAGALGQNLGKPYTDIPDPFGEVDSYGEHFTNLLEESADLIGVPIEMVSNTELYENGDFDPVVRRVLERADEAREVLSQYQDKVDDEYVPFMAQCEECGTLTQTITSVDLDSETVEYVCDGIDAGDRHIEGCGHEGTATFREGKLPWRFEWPGQWQVLGVDFEPFGKDHAEGSWPSGDDIARNVLGIEPPVPMVYEWFTLNGDPLSSSEGNIVTVDEILELLEPEVLRYFFVRNPKKAKDFDISRLDQLVDEFDRFERIYFGEEDDENLDALADRAYPFVVDEVREERVRLPYTFAAVLGMTDDRDLRIRMATNEGYFDEDTPEWAVEEALERVERAHAWAQRLDNQYNYRLQADLPDVAFDADVEEALEDLAAFVEEGHDGGEIQGEIYEAAKRHDVDVGEFFEAGYRLFFDQTQGPRLGEFLGELDRDLVVKRLRREA